MITFWLVLGALRWRRAAAATIFVIGVLGVLIVTLAPIALRAVEETSVRNHVGTAGPGRRTIFVRATSQANDDTDLTKIIDGIAAKVSGGAIFERPARTESLNVGFRRSSTSSYITTYSAVSDLCAHVTMVRGKCLSSTDDIDAVVSEQTARALGVSVGDRIRPKIAGDNQSPQHDQLRMRVVGVYRARQPDGDFWGPLALVATNPPSSNGNVPLPAIFVTTGALDSVQGTFPEDLLTTIVMSKSIGFADLPTARRHVAAGNHAAAVASATVVPPPEINTALTQIFDVIDHEAALDRGLVLVAAIQLGLLAVLVLYRAVASTAEVQGPEAALGKLRGRRLPSILAQSIGQPMVLVLVAAPVGAALAWVVARAAGSALGDPVRVAFPTSAYVVAGVAAGGAVLAAAVALRRVVVTSVGTLLRRGGDRTSPVGLAVLDGAVVVLAAAAVVELRVTGVLTASTANPLVTLVPALLGIAAAVAVVRLLPYIGRAALRATRNAPGTARFFSVRRLVRRPASARGTIIVAVALAIATFAVSNWWVSVTNVRLRSLYTNGAETVYDVRPAARVLDVRKAVDAAAPDGGAMAAAAVRGQNGGVGLLAVDTHRYAGVGAWTDSVGAPLSQAVRVLTPSLPPPVTITGSAVRARVDLSHVELGRQASAPITLALTLVGSDHVQHSVTFARLRRGAHDYIRPLPADCAQSCSVSTVSVSAATSFSSTFAADSMSGTIGLDTSSAGKPWRAVPGFNGTYRWRPAGVGTEVFVSVTHPAPALNFSSAQTQAGADWPYLVTTSVPSRVPAAVGSGTAAGYTGAEINTSLNTNGLDGVTVGLNGVLRVVALPQLDHNGVMVDLGEALAAMRTSPAASTRFEVWAGPHAPPDLRARLARQGLPVTGVHPVSTPRAKLDLTGPVLAGRFFLVTGLGAALLSLAAVLLGDVVSARRRGYELAALRLVGVRRRVLRRATAVDQFLVLAIGLVVGGAAGAIGTVLALPGLRYFADSSSTGPPQLHAVPWLVLGLCAAGVALVFMTVSGLAAVAVERQAGAEQLREVQQ